MISLYQFRINCEGVHCSTENVSENKKLEVKKSNSLLWYEQIKGVFAEGIKLPIFEDVFENGKNYAEQTTITREWFKFASNLLKGRDCFDFEISKDNEQTQSYKVVSVIPMHNRYQRCIYLQVYFDGEVVMPNHFNRLVQFNSETMGDASVYSSYLREHFEGFEDNFSFFYKEKPEYFKSDLDNSYFEKIFLCNPCRIYDENNGSGRKYFEIKNSSDNCQSKVSFDFDIRPSKKESSSKNYERGIEVSYCTSESYFLDIAKHYTSMFILFQRSSNYVREYMRMDNDLNLLFLISQKISNVWGKGRAYLMSLEDTKEQQEAFNTAYFKIMELNTLLDGEVTYLQSKAKNIREDYIRQYDRVLANINNFDEALDEKHNFLLKLLTSPIKYRDGLLNTIKELKEPTNLQVMRLKDMFDSRNSSHMTKIMNNLTILVAVWGVVTFVYSSIFSALNVNELLISIPVLVGLIGFMGWIYFKYADIRKQNKIKTFSVECKSVIIGREDPDNYRLVELIKEYKNNIIEEHTHSLVELTNLLTTIIVYKLYSNKFEYKEIMQNLQTF